MFLKSIHHIIPVLLLIVLSVYSTTLYSQPVIEVSKTEVDFGVVDQTQLTTNTITIMNKGTAPLLISGIITIGCNPDFDCLNETNEISPKGTSTVLISFYSPFFKGLFRESYFIYSNDPKNPKIQLRISVFIKPSIVLMPPKAQFWINDEEKITRIIILKNITSNNYSISKIDPLPFNLKYEISQINEVDYCLTLTLDKKEIKDIPDKGLTNKILIHLLSPPSQHLTLFIPVVIKKSYR